MTYIIIRRRKFKSTFSEEFFLLWLINFNHFTFLNWTWILFLLALLPAILPLIGLSARITANLLFRSRMHCCRDPAMGANFLKKTKCWKHDGVITSANRPKKPFFNGANSLESFSSDSSVVYVASGVGRSVTEDGKKSESSSVSGSHEHISFTLNQF